MARAEGLPHRPGGAEPGEEITVFLSDALIPLIAADSARWEAARDSHLQLPSLRAVHTLGGSSQGCPGGDSPATAQAHSLGFVNGFG